MVTEHGVCDHNLRKEIKILGKIFLFPIIVCNMRLLAILQVKADGTMLKDLHRDAA